MTLAALSIRPGGTWPKAAPPETLRDGSAMKLFYGWVIVGAGIVITCLGMGTMMSLGIFLQPMSAATGWSRTSISTAALLNFLCMGPASFFWGALSDRIGTRAVVLSGGALSGLGLVAASQAATVGQFQILFGMIIGVAAGSFYAPLTATATRWFTRHRSLAVALISAGFAIGSMTISPLARWLITDYSWRTAMFALGTLSWLFIIPAAWRRRHSERKPARPRVHRGAGPVHAAIRRHRAHLLRMLRGTFGSDLPYGQLRDRLRRAGNGCRDRVRRGGSGGAERSHRRRARGRPRRREAP